MLSRQEATSEGGAVWLSYFRVLELEGISYRTLQRRIRAGTLHPVIQAVQADNGRKLKVILLSDLSAAAQGKFWAGVREARGEPALAKEQDNVSDIGDAQHGEESGCTAPHCGALSSRGDGEVRSDTSPLPAVSGCAVPARVRGPEAHVAGIPIGSDGLVDEALALARGRGGQLHIYRKRHEAVARVQALLARSVHGGKCAVWQGVANEFGIKVSTLRRWERTLREGGALALWPADGRNTGTFSSIPEALGLAIQESFLTEQRRSAAQVYRDVVVPWCESHEITPPSQATVARYIRVRIRPIERVAFRYGAQAFRAQMEAKVRRNPLALKPNAVWCADHRILDVMVVDGDKLRRPWVTAIADVGTAAFIGYRVCRVPNAGTVAHALRDAILTVGVPGAFLRDNGREFVARRVGGRPVRLRKPRTRDLAEAQRWPAVLPAEVERSGVWEQLGVQLITALPYSPWSKPIESYFGAFSRLFENELLGWVGHDAKSKPEVLRRYAAEGKLVTWAEFQDVFSDLVCGWNSGHICGDRKLTPAQAYQAHAARIPDERTLDFLLQDSRRLKVAKHGIVIKGRRFDCPGLGILRGETVLVRWDGEMSHVVVYDPRGGILIVPEVPDANWQGFSEANKIRARVARAQREHLKARRVELTGNCTLEMLDPTGSYRMAAARLQAGDGAGREHLALPAADAAAAAQAEAREKNDSKLKREAELERRRKKRVEAFSRAWDAEEDAQIAALLEAGERRVREEKESSDFVEEEGGDGDNKAQTAAG